MKQSINTSAYISENANKNLDKSTISRLELNEEYNPLGKIKVKKLPNSKRTINPELAV